MKNVAFWEIKPQFVPHRRHTGAEEWDSCPDEGKVLASVQRPPRLWHPPTFLSTLDCGFLRAGREG
jgi:hypothetical protein